MARGATAGGGWAAGESFTLADCAARAGPVLRRLGASAIGRWPAKLKAYRARLLARPSVARVVEEARPYRQLFPARRARPRLSEGRRLPQQLIGLDHFAEAAFVAPVAAILVGVVAADQARIALAQLMSVGVLAKAKHR